MVLRATVTGSAGRVARGRRGDGGANGGGGDGSAIATHSDTHRPMTSVAPPSPAGWQQNATVGPRRGC